MKVNGVQCFLNTTDFQVKSNQIYFYSALYNLDKKMTIVVIETNTI